MRHCQVDAWGIPTGVTQPHPATSETLGDKVLDHGYDEVQPGAVFAVSAGDRHIEVCFEEGYPAAQVFAPAGDDVIAFEPMAAPTNALRRGNYRVANPGQPATAAFSIRVSLAS
jgi:galactose mutarotase-like enzyme